MNLEQKHRQNCVEDITAIFGCAARDLDYKAYARWLAAFRRINLERLPKVPLKRENLNVLFSRKVGDRFLEIYCAADTGRAEMPEIVETCVLEDTRDAIEAALEYLETKENLNSLKLLARAKMLDPSTMARGFLQSRPLPGEDELRHRIDRRLAAL